MLAKTFSNKNMPFKDKIYLSLKLPFVVVVVNASQGGAEGVEPWHLHHIGCSHNGTEWVVGEPWFGQASKEEIGGIEGC